MSSTQEARLGELDGVLDAQQPTAELGQELFSVVDVIDAQPALRRAFTDPSTADEARSGLIEALFASRVSPGARTVLAEAAKRRWPGASGLAAALERQAVRAVLAGAQSAGRLDAVEDELFRFGRIVDADPALRAALSDRSVPVPARQSLTDDLLGGRVDGATALLVARAVRARGRTFELTLDSYMVLAAALRARSVAKVTVARPLTAEQSDRLAAAVGRQVGREVTLQVTVDPEVLGGVRVTVGDEVIEGTVAGRLTEARRQLS
jgi:F-type H+-transporting ATPase subunit delta